MGSPNTMVASAYPNNRFVRATCFSCVDLFDSSKKENMRAAYPITHISNSSVVGFAGQPDDVIFLTADAFGVLPPISRLSFEQAAYYFLSGYTAKLAGTERGVTEPQATFSACFGEPLWSTP